MIMGEDLRARDAVSKHDIIGVLICLGGRIRISDDFGQYVINIIIATAILAGYRGDPIKSRYPGCLILYILYPDATRRRVDAFSDASRRVTSRYRT